MKLATTKKIVEEVLRENVQARNNNNVLILEVYKKLKIPVFESFNRVLLNSHKFDAPAFGSITRVRRKLVKLYPELDACEIVQEFREEQKIEHIKLAREEI